VLIVSGHKAVRDWLCGAVAALGHSPAAASTTDEAVRLVQVVRTDLVIIDLLGLDEANCGEVVESLAVLAPDGQLPAVCILSPQASATDCAYRGCQACRLPWPVQIEALIQAVSALLGET
jgi:DNA-binding response OmpR family regulator